MSEDEDEHGQGDQDEDADRTGCILDGFGCAGQGCLYGAIQASCLVFLIWAWADL